MKQVHETSTSPKGGRFTATMNTDRLEQVEDVVCWLKENSKGRAWWSKTHFRNPKTDLGSVRVVQQRHFTGGYWMLSVWFANKADAALFRLFWGDA